MTDDAQRERFLKLQARHVRRCLLEAGVVVVIIVVAISVSSVILYTQGYVAADQRPEQPSLIWGMPAWVVCGLVFPWLATIVATWLFALFVMKDDEPFAEFPAGARQQDADPAGRV